MGVVHGHGELKVVVLATGPGTFSKDEESRYPSERRSWTETGRFDSRPSSTRVIDREFRCPGEASFLWVDLYPVTAYGPAT